MRRSLPVAIAAAILPLLAPTAASAAAAPGTAEAPSIAGARADRTPWSVAHDGAQASGERWREPNGIFSDLVVEGELTGAGAGCHSVWTRFVYDLAPAFPAKQAEVCGAESAAVSLRAFMMPTTTAYITVCRGTEDTADCASWSRL